MTSKTYYTYEIADLTQAVGILQRGRQRYPYNIYIY